jgi:hypothetical protein
MFLTIRCHHLFTCVVAMTYLRQIEIKMGAAGHNRMAEEIMNDILHFFANVCWESHRCSLLKKIKNQSEFFVVFPIKKTYPNYILSKLTDAKPFCFQSILSMYCPCIINFSFLFVM